MRQEYCILVGGRKVIGYLYVQVRNIVTFLPSVSVVLGFSQGLSLVCLDECKAIRCVVANNGQVKPASALDKNERGSVSLG